MHHSLFSKILLTVSALTISGCSFRPLLVHEKTHEGAQPFRLEMTGKGGYYAYKFEQELRRHLALIPKKSSRPFILQVRLNEKQSDITFSRDATVLRSDITMTASYKLLQEGTDQILAQNTLSGNSSYSIHNDDEYLSVTARQGAQKRSTILLAEDLAREVGFALQ